MSFSIVPRIVFSIKNNINLLLTGAPGIGKTKIVLSSCLEAGIKAENIIFIHASIKSPTDFSGLPFRANDSFASFLPYGDLYRMMETSEKTVVFFDDLGQGSTLVQAAIMQLIEERKIGDKKISDFVSFILATNRTTDGAGVSKLLEPLKGRCAIYEMSVNNEQWLSWALSASINPIVCAFIKNNPSGLHDFTPTSNIENYASPRNYERLSKYCEESFFSVEDCVACVGNKYGIQFFDFFRTFNDISHIPKQVINDPLSAEIPDRKYYFALITVLSRVVVNKTDSLIFNKVMNYLNRFDEGELYAWTMQYITNKNKDYINTKTYLEYCANR